tara:strand:- start:222 stop:599 length:378 start_codon:yes stop_codon:yes gene_type:complete
MASELRVNTLKDASGNNSVALSTVAPGVSKAFVRFNGTGTLAVNKSLNHSSVTDNSTGNYTPVYTSNFSDVNSCVTMSKKNESSNASFGINNASVATNNHNMQLYENNSATDTAIVSSKTVGDLA